MERFLIVAVAATLLVGVMATPSAARPDEIHATAVGIFAEELDPGESWFRGDILHVRNVIWRVQLLGFGGLEGAQVRWDLESDTCGFVTDMAATIFFPGR